MAGGGYSADQPNVDRGVALSSVALEVGVLGQLVWPTVDQHVRHGLPPSPARIGNQSPVPSRLGRRWRSRACAVGAGTDLSQIALMPPTWAQEKRINTLLGSAVVSIDPQRRVVATDRGRFLEYDRLILATGSNSFIPSMEGWGLSGVRPASHR